VEGFQETERARSQGAKLKKAWLKGRYRRGDIQVSAEGDLRKGVIYPTKGFEVKRKEIKLPEGRAFATKGI